jgi:hypothetical protein
VLITSGHGDRVGGVAWHPQATLTQGEGLVNLVSGAGDMCVNLWSLNRWVILASFFPPRNLNFFAQRRPIISDEGTR